MNTDWLKQRTRISPTHPALIFEGQVWDYAALDAWVNGLCHALQEAGLDDSGVAAVLLPNTPLHIATIHALARLGITMLPLNNRLTTDEMAWQLEDVGAKWVLVNADSLASVSPVDGLILINLDELKLEKTTPFQESTKQSTDLQGIFYTSGTTGKPKGAGLSYANYYHSAMASAYRLGALEDDRWLLTMPLYHIGGQSIVFRACLYGITVVLQDGFDPDAVYRAIEEDGVTLISVVPTMLHRLLPIFKASGIPETLRVVLVGGAKAAQPLLEEALEIGLPIALTYGLTEATSQVATATPSVVRSKPGTVGKALFGTMIEVLNEEGTALPQDEIGEIVVSGPTVMAGYTANKEATEKALRGGKLFTGDLGYLDEDGDLWMVTRRSDLIVSGGENVYPAEVEAVLLKHPAVREVCVVGIEDEEWCEVVTAVIVSHEAVSEESLTEFSREHLAGYKIPRQFYFIDVLPKTASGKIMRRAVIEQISQLEINQEEPQISAD